MASPAESYGQQDDAFLMGAQMPTRYVQQGPRLPQEAVEAFTAVPEVPGVPETLVERYYLGPTQARVLEGLLNGTLSRDEAAIFREVFPHGLNDDIQQAAAEQLFAHQIVREDLTQEAAAVADREARRGFLRGTLMQANGSLTAEGMNALRARAEEGAVAAGRQAREEALAEGPARLGRQTQEDPLTAQVAEQFIAEHEPELAQLRLTPAERQKGVAGIAQALERLQTWSALESARPAKDRGNALLAEAQRTIERLSELSEEYANDWLAAVLRPVLLRVRDRANALQSGTASRPDIPPRLFAPTSETTPTDLTRLAGVPPAIVEAVPPPENGRETAMDYRAVFFHAGHATGAEQAQLEALDAVGGAANVAQLAAQLGMSVPEAEQAFRDLADLGIVHRFENGSGYCFNGMSADPTDRPVSLAETEPALMDSVRNAVLYVLGEGEIPGTDEVTLHSLYGAVLHAGGALAFFSEAERHQAIAEAIDYLAAEGRITVRTADTPYDGDFIRLRLTASPAAPTGAETSAPEPAAPENDDRWDAYGQRLEPRYHAAFNLINGRTGEFTVDDLINADPRAATFVEFMIEDLVRRGLLEDRGEGRYVRAQPAAVAAPAPPQPDAVPNVAPTPPERHAYYDQARQIIMSTKTAEPTHLSQILGIPPDEAMTILDQLVDGGVLEHTDSGYEIRRPRQL